MTKQELQAFEFIDALLTWEGQFNVSDLVDQLLVSRQTAQKLTYSYKQNYPYHYKYNPSKKINIASDSFVPKHWQGSFRDYQRLLKNKLPNRLTDLDIICSPQNPLHNKALRLLNYACRKKLILEVDYGSLTDASNHDGRLIAPHSIVMDGLRAHVRAFCFKNNQYRDFIVGRFRTLPQVEREVTEKIGVKYDNKWNKKIQLVLCADPFLNNAQKQNIEMEYQMIDGQLIVETSIALLPYVIKRLRLDIRRETPEAQQLIIVPECYKKINKYLPSQ